MKKVFIEFVYVINEIECRVQVPPNTPFDVAKELANQLLQDITAMEEQVKNENKEEAKVKDV